MSNINELFVPYAESLELKELGFDEPCFGWFTVEGDGAKSMFVPEKCSKQDIGLCLAPTFSQAFKFFRKKYNLIHCITDFIDDETGIEWDYAIAVIGTDLSERGEYVPLVDYSIDDENRKFKSYEQAELECLRKLIEIAKNGKTN